MMDSSDNNDDDQSPIQKCEYCGHDENDTVVVVNEKRIRLMLIELKG